MIVALSFTRFPIGVNVDSGASPPECCFGINVFGFMEKFFAGYV